MKKNLGALVIGLLAIQSAGAQTAMEKAEKRIAALVAPGGQIAAGSDARPIAWKAGAAVENIDAPLPLAQVSPVRLVQLPLKDPKPKPAAEGPPLVDFQDKTKTPKQVELPTKPLIRLPSIDVQTPLAIPILAKPVNDRASLAEPMFEASVEAALRGIAPKRERPTPFIAYNLPDPFEYMRYGQLRNPPEENATPPVVPIQRPVK